MLEQRIALIDGWSVGRVDVCPDGRLNAVVSGPNGEQDVVWADGADDFKPGVYYDEQGNKRALLRWELE